ncbi:predicted protein [Streptomyces sviceus ATCC 29083]|uniref:Uncharacterized protein n=1 Tax=Streptomyces sviceus (strain ATCC 29083 / DSM 924 / JCM 4929 / NBRC 13980 / NCIMB 11184 / NRRL 5439 / UC 5370) TaxID=463191 RepID=D6XBS1_STRX2|nr:predicted protein [Streptomyces sviceus ATCC 29083]
MPALLPRKKRVTSVSGQVKRFDCPGGKGRRLEQRAEPRKLRRQSRVDPGFGSAHGQTAPLSPQRAVVVLTLVPLLTICPCGQKHFPTGVLSGALRG